MRLVFLLDNLDKIGGGSYAQFMFARTLARRGHEVTIFAGNRNFLSDDLDREPHLTVHYRPVTSYGLIYRIRKEWHKRTVIEPWLKKNKVDWLVGYWLGASVKAQQLGAKFNIPVANFVFETPGWIESDMGTVIEGNLAKAWQRARGAYDKSTILIPNSALAGKKLLEWLPTAKVSEPVFPGVRLPENQVEVPRDIDIIYVGRLRPHKNVDIILRNASPDHRIVIIGSGDEQNKLREIAAGRSLNVEFTGTVSDADKWNYLFRSKLMIFPSRFEGFGMPPLEALACGCHVLCSDIPIFREIYGDGVAYFDLQHPEIDEQIDELLKLPAPDRRSPLIDKYTWENSGKRIEKILAGSEY